MTEERDIGAEILNGIRELKQGKTGRVVNVPAVAEVRARPDYHSRGLLHCLGYLFEHYRIGSKGAAHLPELRGHYF